MNKPLPPQLISNELKYDTIIDFGSLEHIYNAPQAFKNISTLLADGGQILHALPANNWCGHGFWQFSPELFFSLYSDVNGYANTKVFFADLSDNKHWYEVRKPENGIRSCMESCTEVYVLVITKKISTFFSHDTVQQSDFVLTWDGGISKFKDSVNSMSAERKLNEIIKRYPLLPLAVFFHSQV